MYIIPKDLDLSPVIGEFTTQGRRGREKNVCPLYFDRAAFDILFPRLLADLSITRSDNVQLAEGGLLDVVPRDTAEPVWSKK